MIIHIPEKYKFDNVVKNEDCETHFSLDILRIAREISQIISDEIKELIYSKNTQQTETRFYLGDEVKIPCISNIAKIKYPLYKLFEQSGDISIYYKVYILDPHNKDYHKACQVICRKCFCDCFFEKNVIEIETYINDGQFNNAFLNDICEEIVHYFGINGAILYKLEELYQSDNRQKKMVGYALLNSFFSTQDTMINDLFLTTDADKIEELFYTDKYSISPDFKRFWDVIESIEHEHPSSILESVGYTFNQFAKRINKLDRRMEKKIEEKLFSIIKK